MEPGVIGSILRKLATTNLPELDGISQPEVRRAIEEAARIVVLQESRRLSGDKARQAIICHVAGVSKGNPGPAGIGVVMWDEAGSFREEHQMSIGEGTNNVAEYEAVLFACRKLKELGYSAVKMFSDSELLVRQIQGEYRVKNPRLRELYEQVQKLLRSFDDFEIAHVDRGMNARADQLANRAVEAAAGDRDKMSPRGGKGTG